MVLSFQYGGTVTERPRGENEVRTALIEAAIASYVGEADFSVRKIAAAAGVNHGQVHHYFGGKQGLRAAMLQWLDDQLDHELAEAGGHITALMRAAASKLSTDRRYVRALARRLLEEPDADAYQDHFAVVRRLRDTLGAGDDEASHIAMAEGLARALGWSFFGTWIRQALDLDDDTVRHLEARLVKPSLLQPKES